MQHIMGVLQALVLCLWLEAVYSFPWAPPYSKCETLKPFHDNNQPQTSASPFEITVSNTSYVLGGSAYVNITARGSYMIKGFLLQARSNDSAILWPVGKFTEKPESDTMYLYCSGSETDQNTVGHKNPNRSTWSIREFKWQAPLSAVGDIKFWATVVHNFTTFWTNIQSNFLTGPAAAPVTQPNPGTNFDINKNGCGETKSCFSMPTGCTDSSDCNYLVTYSVTGDNVTFEMSAKGDYVAVGFNDKQLMDKADDIACVRYGNGALLGKVFVNNNHSPERQQLTSAGDFTLEKVFHTNGVIKCRVSRKINPASSFLKNLNVKRYFLFAHGTATSTGSMQYHGNTQRAFTPDKVDITKHQILTGLLKPPPVDKKFVKTGCGTTKGCFSNPASCTDSNDCDYLVTYKKVGDSIEFELSAKDSWAAVGFNSVQKMPKTDAMMCATINSAVVLNHYDLQSYSPPTKSNLAVPSVMSLTSGIYEGGRTICKFKRKILGGGQNGLRDLNSKYYLLFASGPVSGSTPGKHTWKVPSKQQTNVATDYTSLESGSSISDLIKAHGSLMSIAWLGFAAVAIFMARYMRLVWGEEELLGKKVWFTVHRGLMILVVVFSTIGVILAFVNRKGWSEGIGAHPYTGIITFSLALINPIMALFRPHPGASKRFLFNWAHRSVGLSALVLAVVTLFLAVFMPFLKLKETGLPVLIVFCVAVGIVLIFEVYLFCKRSRENHESSPPSKNVEQMQEQRLESSDYTLHKVMLGFVVLVAILTSVTLVIMIAIK